MHKSKNPLIEIVIGMFLDLYFKEKIINILMLHDKTIIYFLTWSGEGAVFIKF